MRARLVILRGEGSPPVHDLTADHIPDKPMTLGRGRANNIVLHDEHASRQHAEVYHRNGQWYIRDLNTRNLTWAHSVWIKGQEAPLLDGYEVGIADIRLRFLILEGNGAPLPVDTPGPSGNAVAPRDPQADSSHTTLQADELAALYDFMSAAVEGADAGAVIRKALATVTRHTRATVAGFLSLDEEDPLPRVVHPELAQVDFSLSRQLTQRVQEEGRRVWLKAGVDDFEESESLLPFQDAVCVPLKAEGAPLGALHVYKSGRYFTEREVRFCELVAAYSAGHLARLQQCRSLQAENSRLRGQAPRSEDIIGNSPAIQELHQLIARAAPCRSTVFIHGETGSGKELVALALHRQSPRRHGPFCAVNCSAIAPTLLESELFGHEKDAFTGAHAVRAGLFEQADDGTLFLDEIGDMPSDCQSKVLRALETKSYRRVGGNQEIKVDVRVLAATHKDLAALVRAGRFRQDLFFRLRVISIPVPPLRDHLEDLPTLVDHFLDKLAPECGKRKRLTRAAMQCLQEYPWPGNVRELLHVLESAVMMTDGDIVDAPNIRFFQDMPSPSSEMPQSLKLEDVEAWAICQALDRTKGNISRAAKILGISRETLAIKVKKYQIDRERWERAS